MNITLRPARPADAEEMTRWFADLAHLAEWGGPEVRFPLTQDQLAAWIAESSNPQPRLCFTEVDEADRPIGHVQFLREPARQWARLGRFGIAPERRGKGFGRALFYHAVRFAFTELDVEHLALAVVATNEPAIRLYVSSGFRDEETSSDSRMVGGRPYAVNLMGLVRSDWLRLAGARGGATKVA
jgi:RimJ/RimL family protein N-acetyltransferase